MPGTRSAPCGAPATRLAETRRGVVRAGPRAAAEPGVPSPDGAAPPAGFRGIAAGFQPGLAPFLSSHAAAFAGLSVAASPGDLVSGVSEMRPDYVLLAEPVEPSGLLRDMAAAARRPVLGVLLLGPEAGGDTDLPEGVVADRVALADPPSEILLTLRALMRRCRPQAMVGQTAFGGLFLDEACLTFAIRGQAVSLSLEVFGVLGAMMDDPERIWERARLHALVFGRGSRNDIRAIDMRISRARRHVAAALGRDPIRTVRGVGYALVPDP